MAQDQALDTPRYAAQPAGRRIVQQDSRCARRLPSWRATRWPSNRQPKRCAAMSFRAEVGRHPCLVAGSMSRSRSEERRVGKSVDLGGRRMIKEKKEKSTVE